MTLVKLVTRFPTGDRRPPATDPTDYRGPPRDLLLNYWPLPIRPLFNGRWENILNNRLIASGSLGNVQPTKAEAMGGRLLEIVVYTKICRIGGTLSLDDLAETSEIGDWKMPDFKAACAYAVSQGWLIVQDDTLTLTTAGLAAA